MGEGEEGGEEGVAGSDGAGAHHTAGSRGSPGWDAEDVKGQGHDDGGAASACAGGFGGWRESEEVQGGQQQRAQAHGRRTRRSDASRHSADGGVRPLLLTCQFLICASLTLFVIPESGCMDHAATAAAFV